VLAAEAQYTLGVARFWQGNFLASRQRLEAGIAAYDPAQQEIHLRLFGQDVLAVCQSRLAVTMAYLGFVDQARALIRAAVARAQALAHPFTIGYVLTWAAVLYCHLGEVDATLETARAAVALSRKHDLAFWLGLGSFLEGWALAQSGDLDGVRVMHEGDAIFRKTGALFKLSWFGARVAAFEAQQGQTSRALARLDAALARVHTYGEEWCLSELMQRRGDILAHEGRRDDARRAYQEALAVAQRQHAAILEQAAALSLRRLEEQDNANEPLYTRSRTIPTTGEFNPN
jgi:tetratricopeptide (TPR) repeat protein